jgi:YspA, cpYpsA-related SLOG family
MRSLVFPSASALGSGLSVRHALAPARGLAVAPPAGGRPTLVASITPPEEADAEPQPIGGVMNDDPVIALFCGSREWSDRQSIRADLRSLPQGSVVVEGGARGADRIARDEARSLGIHVATVPALWRRFGRSAGPRRNQAMLRLRPDVVHAYPLGGRGTAHMIDAAERAAIEVMVHDAKASIG